MKKNLSCFLAICCLFFASCNQPHNPPSPTPNDTIPHDTLPNDTDTVVVPRDTIPEPTPNPISDVETDYAPLNPSGLPTLRINTNGQQVVNREDWVSGVNYQIFDKDSNLILSGETEIKGRGNSTWEMPKKPYSLKLSSKKAILGMPAHKRWALLANYADKTLLRTEIGYKLGYIFDNMAYTPHAEQINFYFNDEYKGVYQISEAIKIDENRVNINKISTSNPNGGFLVECDWRRGEQYNFQSQQGGAGYVWYNCSDPDDGLDATATNGQTLFNIIKNKVLSVEDIVYSGQSLTVKENYIDVNSFIDWFFVNEIVKNVDSQFGLSVFLYYNSATGKIHLGPIWDFDYACGNASYSDAKNATGWWVKNSPWFEPLFNSGTFKNRLKARWNEKEAEVRAIVDFIDERAGFLNKAQQQNFKKWTILDKNTGTNSWVTGSYSDETERTKSWLLQRIDWLDNAINNL
jgi:hypothetical protein